jgi:hypothetical protein
MTKSTNTINQNEIKSAFEGLIDAATRVTERIVSGAPFVKEAEEVNYTATSTFYEVILQVVPEGLKDTTKTETLPFVLKQVALMGSHEKARSLANDALYEYFGYSATSPMRHALTDQQENIRKSLCSLWKRTTTAMAPPKNAEEKCIESINWAMSHLRKCAWTPEVQYAVNALLTLAETRCAVELTEEVEEDSKFVLVNEENVPF